MNEYWVIYTDKCNITPDKIYDAKYLSHSEKISGHIKVENNIYYGTLDVISNINETEWIQIDPKHIYSLTDVDKTIRIIYTLLMFMVIYLSLFTS